MGDDAGGNATMNSSSWYVLTNQSHNPDMTKQTLGNRSFIISQVLTEISECCDCWYERRQCWIGFNLGTGTQAQRTG